MCLGNISTIMYDLLDSPCITPIPLENAILALVFLFNTHFDSGLIAGLCSAGNSFGTLPSSSHFLSRIPGFLGNGTYILDLYSHSLDTRSFLKKGSFARLLATFMKL
jgi:hypothetical protein